jgi:hypothetical protein
MARIRTVKPELFRHEELQDLEINHPGQCPMLVFIALFGHADANGVFPWQPRQLKLDILPFLAFDMSATLDILRTAGFIERYEVDGKEYGIIPTFRKHQKLSTKEATNGKIHPLPSQGSTKNSSGTVPAHIQNTPRNDPESQELGFRNLGIGTWNMEHGKETLPPEALRLSGMLADLILKNLPNHSGLTASKRNRTVTSWAWDIDKMNRIDGRSWEDIEHIIRWCQSDTFWKSNILSGAKLRDKANQLSAKMQTLPTPPTKKEVAL